MATQESKVVPTSPDSDVSGVQAKRKPKSNGFVQRKKYSNNTKNRRTPSLPSVKIKVSLSTEITQNIMRRGYKSYTEDLYSLDVTGRHPTMVAVTDFVEAALLGERNYLDKRLSNEIRQAENLMEIQGIIDVPVYENTAEVTISKTSPRCSDLIELIKQLDQLIMRLDAIWLGEYVPDPDERLKRRKEHYNRKNAWERTFLKYLGAYRFYATQIDFYSRSRHSKNVQDPLYCIFTEAAPFVKYLDAAIVSDIKTGFELRRQKRKMREEKRDRRLDREAARIVERSLDREDKTIEKSDTAEMKSKNEASVQPEEVVAVHKKTAKPAAVAVVTPASELVDTTLDADFLKDKGSEGSSDVEEA